MNPLYASIILIKEHPYKRCKNVDKSDFLRKVKLTPALICWSTDKKCSKVFLGLLIRNDSQ